MTKQDQFLTIKEAIEFTGKSEATIRRLVTRLLKDKSLTSHLKISQKASDKNKYRINKNFLIDHFDLSVTNQMSSQKKSLTNQKQSVSSQEIIQILKSENEFLKKQIQELNQLLGEQQNLTRNEQTLHLASKQKPNWFQRLIGRK